MELCLQELKKASLLARGSGTGVRKGSHPLSGMWGRVSASPRTGASLVPILAWDGVEGPPVVCRDWTC